LFCSFAGFPPDIMHAVYLGTVKHFTLSWFEGSNRGKIIRLNTDKENLIDKRLFAIAPPKRVSRTPRSLAKYGKLYKAHEWAMWLYYYSPIVLKGIVNQIVYDHWMMLVDGMSLLVIDKVTESSFEKSKYLLESFCKLVPSIYNEKHCTFNLHLLFHLPDFAKKYGPLQHFTMTGFENFNMKMIRYVKSSNSVTSQIAKAYARRFIEDCYDDKNFEGSNKFGPKKGNVICGIYEMLTSLQSVELAYQKFLNSHCPTFKDYVVGVKLWCQQKVFYSRSFSRAKKRNSSVFMLSEFAAFEIYYFVYTQTDSKMLVLGKHYDLVRSISLPPYILRIASEKIGIENFIALRQQGIKMPLESDSYIALFLNNVDNNSE